MSDEPETYTCAVCKETFTKTRSDEEALEETAEIFGEEAADGPVNIVCDDCWRKIMGLPPEPEALG